MAIPFSATSLAEADQWQQQGPFLWQKWALIIKIVSHSEVGGRFAPDFIGFISPTAKVTSSLMLEERGFVFRLLSGAHHTVCDETR